MIRDQLKKLAARIPIRTLERLMRYPIVAQSFPEIARSKRFPKREELWTDLLAELADRPACVLEFGVFEGYSLNFFASLNRHPQSVFYGFDSFEGLPEDWHETRKKGHFSTGGSLPQTDDPRLHFVKGWFNQSLPRFWEEQPGLVKSIRSGERELVVHFDADLFSSTLYVLSSLAHRFESYRFIFDDFIVDELRALHVATQAFGLAPEVPRLRAGIDGLSDADLGNDAQVRLTTRRASPDAGARRAEGKGC